jgi:hypothetical protein
MCQIKKFDVSFEKWRPEKPLKRKKKNWKTVFRSFFPPKSPFSAPKNSILSPKTPHFPLKNPHFLSFYYEIKASMGDFVKARRQKTTLFLPFSPAEQACHLVARAAGLLGALPEHTRLLMGWVFNMKFVEFYGLSNGGNFIEFERVLIEKIQICGFGEKWGLGKVWYLWFLVAAGAHAPADGVSI